MSSGPHSSGPAVLCAGRLYCDLIFTGLAHLAKPGEEVFADGLALHAGGGAFITAATISAIGGRAALVATRPGDPFDQLVMSEVAAAGVETELCMPAPGPHAPQITVASVLNEDRAFLTHASGPAVPDVGWPGPWTHLHIGELRTAVEAPWLIDQARKQGMTISLDCGWDDALIHHGSTHAALIGRVDVFLPNAREYAALTASGLPDTAADVTVVKSGPDGARAFARQDDAGWRTHPALPTEVVDTTGAGDAFNGGFLVPWLQGATIDDCLASGVRCGAAAVSQIGGAEGLSVLRSTPAHEAAE
ncbi:carbohydrate kinase family protein [Pseudaestuariivita sp.]|uniref:carbohydrate kinase family protein n=1 Tax=Pseudaestuariivita sp. TaxID=2211669 RepID=UPI004057FC8E